MKSLQPRCFLFPPPSDELVLAASLGEAADLPAPDLLGLVRGPGRPLATEAPAGAVS